MYDLKITIQLSLVSVEALKLKLKLIDFPLHFRVLSEPNPFDLILMYFFYVSYPLKHVCDVVYSALLHSQVLHSCIQIYCLVLRRTDQIYKLFSEH